MAKVLGKYEPDHFTKAYLPFSVFYSPIPLILSVFRITEEWRFSLNDRTYSHYFPAAFPPSSHPPHCIWDPKKALFTKLAHNITSVIKQRYGHLFKAVDVNIYNWCSIWTRFKKEKEREKRLKWKLMQVATANTRIVQVSDSTQCRHYLHYYDHGHCLPFQLLIWSGVDINGP